MLNESHQKPKPRRNIVPTRKRQDETTHVQIEIEKKKKSLPKHRSRDVQFLEVPIKAPSAGWCVILEHIRGSY